MKLWSICVTSRLRLRQQDFLGVHKTDFAGLLTRNGLNWRNGGEFRATNTRTRNNNGILVFVFLGL